MTRQMLRPAISPFVVIGGPGQIGFQLLHFRRYVIQAPPQSRALLGMVVGVLWIRIDLFFITIKIG